MGSQTAQQVDSTKSFTSVLDNKMQTASRKNYVRSTSSVTTQVNREELSAKDSEYEKERDAFVKSDMQQPKKTIARAETKSAKGVSDDRSIKKPEDTKQAEELEAIESVEDSVVEEVEKVEDNKVVQALMELLTNDQLTTEEKVVEINDLLSNLTLEEMESLEGLTGDLKKLLMTLEGSLKNFEDSLSKLPALNNEFSSLLDQMNHLSQSGFGETENVEMPETGVEKLKATVDGGQATGIDSQESQSGEQVPAETVEEKVLAEVTKDHPRESKVEHQKETGENLDKMSQVTEMTNSASTNNQSNQQQTSSEGNQSFTEALKFHSANVKTVAMKGSMASNPFEDKIIQQIIKGTSVSLNVGKDVSEMMIKLNPKELGNVSLKISLENEQLVAKFNVENQTVKEVLESRLDDLRTALSDKGFTIEGLDVSVSQDAEEQFQSYEEFIKQQKGKKRFDEDELEGIESIGEIQNRTANWQTLETTSSEINVLA
jgi:flagellar hook-length control protein FliK